MDAADTTDMGTHRRRRLLAQSAFLVTIGLQVAAALLWVRSGFAIPPASISEGPLVWIVGMAATTTFAVAGLLISLHRPEVRIGQLETALALMLAVQQLSSAYLALGTTPQGSGLAYQPTVALVTAAVVAPLGSACAVILGFLFPSDEYLSPRWRFLVWVTVASAAVAGVGALLRPGPIPFFPTFDNPFGLASIEDVARA